MDASRAGRFIAIFILWDHFSPDINFVDQGQKRRLHFKQQHLINCPHNGWIQDR